MERDSYYSNTKVMEIIRTCMRGVLGPNYNGQGWLEPYRGNS